VLHNVTLGKKEVRPIFDRILYNIDLMLANNRIHGDLSAHNILYWEGEVKIIDFPQAVNPDVNPYGEAIFRRDVTRVCQYFERYSIVTDAEKISKEMWSRNVTLDD
jgi:serine/threonine-protein kinase RIO1